MSAIAVNGTAMAHSGQIDPYPLWNFNFGAEPGSDGTSYIGPGVVWNSSDGAGGVNNYWNYFVGDPVPSGSLSSTGTQVYRATTFTENKGTLKISAPVAYTVDADLINGYIMSNASDITMKLTIPNFGSDSGHVYVYTERGKETADLLGIAGSSTSVLNKMYDWTDPRGNQYDVYEYWVTSTTLGSISFTAHGINASGARVDGYINAMQLTPIPPHPLPVPEPATVTLLGIGGLAGSIMMKRKRFAEA
jgi:hypothetical protein